VLAVFAGPDTRFKRLKNRTNERPIDNIETFEKRDYTEIENIAKGGPIARADYTVVNEKTEKDLYKQIDYYL
jgi:dephospho-CoA kinase